MSALKFEHARTKVMTEKMNLSVRSNNSKSSGLKSRPRSCPYDSVA